MLDDADDYKLKQSFLMIDTNGFVKNKEREGKLRLKFIDEKVMTFHMGIIFDRHSFLHFAFNEKIKKLKESGILETFIFFNSKHRARYSKEIGEVTEPAVLTMDHLSTGFLIWIIMLFIALVVFAFELGVYWGQKLWRSLLLCSVLKSYFAIVENH